MFRLRSVTIASVVNWHSLEYVTEPHLVAPNFVAPNFVAIDEPMVPRIGSTSTGLSYCASISTQYRSREGFVIPWNSARNWERAKRLKNSPPYASNAILLIILSSTFLTFRNVSAARISPSFYTRRTPPPYTLLWQQLLLRDGQKPGDRIQRTRKRVRRTSPRTNKAEGEFYGRNGKASWVSVTILARHWIREGCEPFYHNFNERPGTIRSFQVFGYQRLSTGAYQQRRLNCQHQECAQCSPG